MNKLTQKKLTQKMKPMIAGVGALVVASLTAACSSDSADNSTAAKEITKTGAAVMQAELKAEHEGSCGAEGACGGEGSCGAEGACGGGSHAKDPASASRAEKPSG